MMKPHINHYEGERPNVIPALLPATAPMIRQENSNGHIVFYNTYEDDELDESVVAIFHLTYKS